MSAFRSAGRRGGAIIVAGRRERYEILP